LYKVIIVDDRIDVIKGIIKLTDWSSLHLDMKGYAQTGQTAYALIEKVKPDIVITDIKMPIMDGLALIELTKYKFPGIKFIILSGYDDFTYMQKALRLNVDEYILKPASVDDIHNVLKKMIIKIDEEREERQQVDITKEQLRRSLPLLKDEYFRYLVTHSDALSIEYVQEQFVFLGINIMFGSMIFALIKVSSSFAGENNIDDQLEEQAKQGNTSIIASEGEEYFSEQYECAAFCYSKNEIGILFNYKPQNKQDAVDTLLQMANGFCQKVLKDMNVMLSIGISKIFDNILQIPTAFRQAKEAIDHQFFGGSGSVICYSEISSVRLEDKVRYNDVENRLTGAIRIANSGEISLIINEFFIVNKNIYPTQLIDAVQKLYLVIYYNVLSYLNENIGTPFLEHNLDIEKHFGTIYELKKWLIDELFDISAFLQKNIKNQSQRYVEHAKTIIETGYDSNISLNSIANVIGLTPTYLSAIFKEITDMTFTDYLIHIRIEKAKELLCTKLYKVYEIAQMVGYSNVRYFSELFKKKTGFTPNDFLKCTQANKNN